ncbi:hypothetical protein DSO57_1025966 [Entomophthora muscae]|uniref:Uncharacterized protein n=1 Tax=Entomophthora muscae TaxID=34485 RepID=A0ACC2TDD9_9FUNG|nr:hypothetical protein DSO57_1025966 [Entomophthora muscae]
MKLTCLFAGAVSGIVVGYYAPWGQKEPWALPYNKITHLNYAFGSLHTHATPAKITFDDAVDGLKLREVTQRAHANQAKVLISLGGWTGSQTFSTVVRNATLRAEFIHNAMRFVGKEYGLDGIDIDWEYPGRQGIRCNVVDGNDSQNYLMLLKELRAALDVAFPNQHKLITGAVRTSPFDGADGRPMQDVSAFAKYFDFINIMSYDIFNSLSNTTGPNAPFRQNPYPDAQSFTQSIDAWINAGFPAQQLTAGVPFYGHSFTSATDMRQNLATQIYPRKQEIPRGDRSDDLFTSPVCNEGTAFSGVHKYKYLRQEILVANPYTSSGGYDRYWDNVTLTPWLYSQQTNHYISYEDPNSITIKVHFARCRSLLGMMTWELSLDYNDELIDALNAYSGFTVSEQTCAPFHSSATSRFGLPA